MQISKALNLVIPVESESGMLYVHATPIQKETYREHFLVLSKTFAALFGEGLGVVAGPRIAYLLLEKVAKESGVWEGANGVKNDLIRTIIHGANVAVPIDGKGRELLPLYTALEKGFLERDDVLGELVFFTCVCAINKPMQANVTMTAATGLWSSALTSSGATDWMASLPTLTDDESTGATATTSSPTS